MANVSPSRTWRPIEERTVMASELVIRNMTRAEVEELVGWAAGEGWNPGLHDAGLFRAADPEAFVAAERGGGDRGWSDHGLRRRVRVHGAVHRAAGVSRAGVGDALWHARRERLLARLKPGATIGLDGVFAMQEYYAKGGFVFSHRNMRFRAGVPDGAGDRAGGRRRDRSVGRWQLMRWLADTR
jgi:hypothetical protein